MKIETEFTKTFKLKYPIINAPMFLVSDEIQKLIHQGASHLVLRKRAIEQGMTPLRAEALRLLQEGITTIEEVLQWT